MKVLIIEDEAPAFRRLQKLLEEIDPSVDIVEVIDSVEGGIEWFSENEQPDLIFSDIQLSDGISFEIYDKIRIAKPIIFTTAFDDYMLKAFRVNSIDYLLKPIKKEDLQQSLNKYSTMQSVFGAGVDLGGLLHQIKLGEKDYKSRFLVKMGDELLSVETANIAYFLTRHGVVHLVTNQGKTYLMDCSLDELVGQLDPERFFRANRQFVIKYDSIASVNRYHKGKLLVELTPAAEEGVIVSAEKASEFRKWLGD